MSYTLFEKNLANQMLGTSRNFGLLMCVLLCVAELLICEAVKVK